MLGCLCNLTVNPTCKKSSKGFHLETNLNQAPLTIMTYTVTLTYDGITRAYHCENHFDTVILFDALHRAAQWESITVIDNRTGYVMQSAVK